MARPRRILAFDWLSADGYFAGFDGNLNWVVPDDEQAKAAATGTPGADTVLFGRRTRTSSSKDSGGKPCKTPPRRRILTVPGSSRQSTE
jgi:dihydrofolate reductase